MGSLLPDLLRPCTRRVIDALPPVVRDAALQHRAVDAFTDAHPRFQRSRQRLLPEHGRFAPVLIDVFYDHLLARDFAHFHAIVAQMTRPHDGGTSPRSCSTPAPAVPHDGMTLDEFVHRVYAALAPHLGPGPSDLIPPAMRPPVLAMIQHDWLRCYRTIPGVRITLARMSARISTRLGRAIDLTPAADTLDRLAPELDADFRAFWPELLGSVR